MRDPKDVLLSLLLFSVIAQPLLAVINELSGKHLRIIPLEISPYVTFHRNSSGNITGFGGPGGELLDSLSQYLNFSYEILQVNLSYVDDMKTTRGAISYLVSGEADLMNTPAAITVDRFKKTSPPHPWLFTSLNLLIPAPQPSVQIKAVVKPYSSPVWISLIIAVISVTFALWFLARLYNIFNKDVTEPEEEFNDLSKTWSYILALLLSQGGSVQSKKLFVRLAAGTWCLACFVLVNAYSSTLISYVTTPDNDPPVINSINDIHKVPKLHLCAVKGMGPDTVISGFRSGPIKDLKKDMDNHPETRCINMTSCIDLVSSGSCAFFDTLVQINTIAQNNFLETNKCNFVVAKEGVLPTFAGFALPKNSPYRESLNIGILRMQEAGLMGKWEREHYKKPDRCIKDPNSHRPKRALTLANLTGAFVFLGIGYFLSVSAFIMERVRSRYQRG